MTQKPDNPQAFPNGWVEGDNGMTLRDYFAAAALQGLCACPNLSDWRTEALAGESYLYADAMLKVREATHD